MKRIFSKRMSMLIAVIMLVSSVQLPAFATADEPEVPEEKTYVIYDASKQTGDNITQFAGKTAYKWGPTEEALTSGPFGKLEFEKPEIKYKDLVFEIYSAKATHHPIYIMLYNVGGGRYRSNFRTNWEGGWKKIRIPISGGLTDCGDFEPGSGTPSLKPYEISEISLNAKLYDSSNFDPDTEMYISKIYFEGEGDAITTPNSNGEIILPDRYDSSVMTDYVAMLKEKHPDKQHPRLLVSDEIINRIKANKDSNAFMKKTYEAIEKRANKYLEEEPSDAQYIENGEIAYSRNVESIAKDCGMMYLITGEEKYAERIWQEAAVMIDQDNFTINSAAFWYDTSTGLDAGHIANGMALLYDWCYDYLSDDRKLAIRNALMEHAFDYAENIRNGSGYMGFRNNVVAANSKGFMTAALAICDEPGYENFCNEFINNVIDYLPLNLEHQFVPDGSYAESPSYWRYTVASLMFMTDAMLTSMGTDGGIQEMNGLEETCYFPFAVIGNTYTKLIFNYSDSVGYSSQFASPAFQYLAKRYEVPALRAYRLATIDDDAKTPYAMEDLLWYDPELPDDTDWASALPKDYFLDGLAPIVSMRSGFNIENDGYIAAKGGSGKVGHAQYDAGSFVLDALGTRWICDPGANTYDREGTPSNHFYRVRAEGNNCIVFDPENQMKAPGTGQTVAQNAYDTYCPIVDSASGENEAFAIMNLQPSYQETVNEYKRGYALLSSRSQFIVQDEFETKAPYELYSYYHFKGVEVVASDARSITLKKKTNPIVFLKVDFITDIPDFEIGVMDAVQHPSSPTPPATETDNSAIKKIFIHAKNVQKGTIAAVFTPIENNKTVVPPQTKPLADWDEYIGNDSYANYQNMLINNINGNSITVVTNHKVTGRKTIILASYKNDALVTCKSVTVSNIDSTSYNGLSYTRQINLKKYTIPGFDPGDHDTIKAFIWDDMSSTLRPVCAEHTKRNK